jgi:hypothetical protein
MRSGGFDMAVQRVESAPVLVAPRGKVKGAG